MIDENTILNEFVKFDENAGLSVSTQSKIFEDLKLMLQSSFGADFVIQEGSEMFTFLDLLATSLAHSAGEYKKIYDSLGFINATGVTLDNAVSLAGITREGLVRSYVDMTITRSSSTGTARISAPIRIQDINGNNWYCDEDIDIAEGVTSVIKRFYASDGNAEAPYSIFIKSYNGVGKTEGAENWKILTVAPQNVTFQNINDSVLGQEKESDSQLRYRYYTSLHNSSTGTVDGLKSKLLNANNFDLSSIGAGELRTSLHTVNIYQNNTDNTNDKYGVKPHSIWVIVDGVSQWDGNGGSTTDEDDITIAKIIKYFKSMGVNTSSGSSQTMSNGEGAVTYTDEDGNVIRFSRAQKLNCYVSIKLEWKAEVLEADKVRIKSAINEAIKNYVNNLGINNDVLFTGISSAIYNLYPTNGYEDFIFDITELKIGSSVNPSGTRLLVDIYQYAQISDDKISIV